MSEKPARGGSRKGAGRKPTGKNTVTRSVSMPAPVWDELDRQRGAESRGKFIERILPK